MSSENSRPLTLRDVHELEDRFQGELRHALADLEDHARLYPDEDLHMATLAFNHVSAPPNPDMIRFRIYRYRDGSHEVVLVHGRDGHRVLMEQVLREELGEELDDEE